MSKIFTDNDLLLMETEAIDALCVPNIGDDHEKIAYYHNGQYTDYGMDVKTLQGILDKL